MTVGFGASIGTVNSVSAGTAGEHDLPAVRVRRTAVTFDSAGGARIGGLPRFAPVVTDFADLTREFEPVVVAGRNWTSADLVAAVATCLIGAAEPEGEPVITYPACYPEAKVATLRHALDWAGATATLLMPEPVAAAEWLDAEYGVSDNGITLVYDLGGSCLDIAVVRTEADRNTRGVLGKPVRSYEYGGRPLGTTLARYARALSPGAAAPVSTIVPPEDTTRLRTWNIRNSLRLVRRCVRAAGLTLGDIDRILLVGGAARPVEVAQVIAELGRPVVMSPDPAHTVAAGAALASARMADTGADLGRYARGAAVISSAAVVSAMAMSAATMLGSGPIGTDGPALEFAPALAGPAPDAARDVQVFGGSGQVYGGPSAEDAAVRSYSRVQAYSTVAQPFSADTADVRSAVAGYGPGTHCGPSDNLHPPIYADPAQFVNPLPFATNGAAIPSISLPRTGHSSGNNAAQHISRHGTLPGTWDPSARVVPPSLPKSSPANPGAAVPVAGTQPPIIGPRVWKGPSDTNSTGVVQNSNPGTSSAAGVRPGSDASVPSPRPGTVNSPGVAANGGSASSPEDNTAPVAPGGSHPPSSPGDATSDAGITASAPTSGNGLSQSPGHVAPHDMSNHFGNSAATPNSADAEASRDTANPLGGAGSDGASNTLGGHTSNSIADSFGGATPHSSDGGTTSEGSSSGDGTSNSSFGGTSHNSFGGTSHNSLGGTSSHSSSNSAGGDSASGSSHSSSSSGGSHGGSSSGGSHGGSSGGGSHGGGGHH